MAVMCNQLIAGFLQLGQRIFHKGKIVPQYSQDQIIGCPRSSLFCRRLRA
jgi:hypothetical protein